MMPYLLNACPRCAGALAYDRRDEVWNCLSCGFVSPPAEVLDRPQREREPRHGGERLG